MSDVCVRVAVRIRPLLPKEVLYHHKVCARVVPQTAQVMLGEDRLFSFDHAFGPSASQDEVYESCVRRLLESLIDGDNAAVFCYGQTGSGKTYTLGGGNQDEEGGIIERVAQDVFLLLADKRKQSDGVDVSVKVSYMELYKEELRDLLELQTIQKELRIREDERGNTVVVGAKEFVVTSAEELLSVVDMGNALRHTGTTGMNVHSSRSHTILTLQVILSCHNSNSSLKSVNSSKLCLVDLAGSERAGKTGNTGARLKETAYINTGLLALGNVIRALSEQGRNKHSNAGSVHIPYRDAKITRLLRDSLGGTARTLMVVCVSPSHHFVAETLSVLQFACKARYIHNRPAETSAQTEVSSRPATTWHSSDARLGELEYEVQTLRELLKEEERELKKEREKTGQRCREGDGIKVSCQTGASDRDKKANPEEASQYRLLAEEAAVLLADISGPSPSLSFRLRLQDWQERLTAVSHSSQTHEDYSKAERDQLDPFTSLKLREELKKCQEALHIEEQLLEQKDAELRQVQKELKQLLQERKTHLISLEEVKQHFRIQTEQLVNQQILIDRLRSELMIARGATVEAGGSADSGKRPHSVPLIRHSCIWRPPRKIHSSPPAYTLERVMAAFKMRGHLLLAEMEEKDEVYCPFLKQQAESTDGGWEKKEEEEVEEDDTFMGRTRFRCSLNQTWTSRQKKSTLNEKNTGADQTCDGKPQRATGTKENQLKQRHMRKARIKASAAERRVHDLSVSMHLKEELIKELHKTEKETQFLDTHDRQSDDGREASVFARLSLQSQRVRAEMYHSLQHMRAQQSQLQSSLRDSENSKARHKNGEQSAGVSTICRQHNLKHINEQLCGNSWLEEEEEYVLQKRAELRELEEEMRSREEVLLHREACLQQKSKLETKMLCSSQALSQDLLHVSMQLESLQEQLQSNSNVRKRAGVTIEELEKERDMLKKRRDTLDAQLKDNRVLTVEETHSLLQLEEAIEALNAALEFKNRLIQDKKKNLLLTNFSLHQSQNAEPAQLCDVTRKLMDLSLPEALQLLVKYFNKVVCLREAERHLHLRCEELELHVEEQKTALREMEAVIQRLSLDADRRLTQQHSDHQHNIQLLLQKLKEGAPGETQQAMQDRLQHLEKELFFYKSTSRQLKKKLKALLGDGLYTNDEPSCSQEPKPVQKMQIYSSSNESQTNSEEIQTGRHIVTMYTKIHAEQIDKKMHNDTISNAHQTKCSSLFSDSQSLKKTKVPEYNQIFTQFQGKRAGVEPKERLEMTPVRLCRRDLKQICPADLQVSGSTTGRRQSAVATSTESILEDSIEVPRNSDR